MNSLSGTFDLPRRSSLSVQAAAAIRKAIDQNKWREVLPSERRLCELLQVSRPTIRTAVQLLAKEGLLKIRHGRNHRILASRRRKEAPPSRLILIIAPQNISEITATAWQGLSEMRGDLALHGFATEVIRPPPGGSTQQKKIQRILRQTRVLCCVLISVSRELQAWFSQQAIPSLVVGSCHPEIALPSLDVDYRSVCRHAAGILRSRGHRRIAFLVPHSEMAGDLASEAGFLEGQPAKTKTSDSAHLIIRHNGRSDHLLAKLETLLNSPQPPTALLVAKPAHTLSVITHLLARGLRVPHSLSLIARDHDRIFGDAISHYHFTEKIFAQRLTRLILHLVSNGQLPPAPNFIFPRYMAGRTVKPLSP
ncbi:MAG: hypothetical protein RL077_3334 [Verrucomicrobiota bacterium]